MAVNMTDILLGTAKQTVKDIIVEEAYIDDAPSDGTEYIRKDSVWVTDPRDVVDAPEDSSYYLRKDADWFRLNIGGVVEESGQATFVVDASAARYFEYTLDQAATITIINAVVGDTGTIVTRQLYADNTVTFGGDFILPRGQPTISAGSDAVDVFRFTCTSPGVVILEYPSFYAPEIIGWEITSTGGYQQSSGFPGATTPKQQFWRPDGLRMYLCDSDHGQIHQYNFTTPWDLTTMTYSGLTISTAAYTATPMGIQLSSDGRKAFVGSRRHLNADPDYILEIELDNAWSFSGAASFDAHPVPFLSSVAALTGFNFSRDGRTLYHYQGTASTTIIWQCHLDGPWDLFGKDCSTPSFTITQDHFMPELWFDITGHRMFMGGYVDDRIYEYYLPSAFDFRGGFSYTGDSWHSEFGTTPLYGFSFSNNGEYLFANLNGTLYRYPSIL